MSLAIFKSAGLPSVQTLSTSLRNLQSEAGGSSGHVLLKMDKTGHWVFGAGQDEVEEGSKWAVNPFSFIHGFIAWGGGAVLGEKIVAISVPLPVLDEAPQGAENGWQYQIGMSLKCITGKDKDLEVRYATTSVGGKKATQELGIQVANQIDANPDKPVPIITLKKEHYNHKMYSRIYTPVFQLLEWVTMNSSPEEEEAPVATKVRRRLHTSV